ncbi:MAG: hypothetical protein M3442_08205 [Chloroflexota bacterium]|nr:hypothetical protein [Chloroflexota bacterium]
MPSPSLLASCLHRGVSPVRAALQIAWAAVWLLAVLWGNVASPARIAEGASDHLPALQTVADGGVVQLRGTPHLWIAAGGSLHWAGDTRGLVGHAVNWGDRREVDLDTLRRYPLGGPWLSAGLVKIGDPIYFVKWETAEATPTLLHVQSIGDVELFGINAGNYGALVLDQAAWERRFGLATDSLARRALPPATAPAPPRQAPGEPCQVTVERAVVEPEGVLAALRNDCDAPRRFSLSFVVYDVRGGQPLVTTATGTWNAAPKEEAQFHFGAPRTTATFAVPLRNAGSQGDSQPTVCLDVGARACLITDPFLYGAVKVLMEQSEGLQLLRTAAGAGVQLQRRETDVTKYGTYRPDNNTITVDSRLDTVGDWERAAVLAHELQHAADDVTGKLGRGTTCLGNEEDAFRTQAKIWSALWKGKLPQPWNAPQADLNDVSQTVERDPLQFARSLAALYRVNCA